MPKFIPSEKLGKKARRALDAEKRATWGFSPVTRKVENKKRYNRKKQPPLSATEGLFCVFHERPRPLIWHIGIIFWAAMKNSVLIWIYIRAFKRIWTKFE